MLWNQAPPNGLKLWPVFVFLGTEAYLRTNFWRVGTAAKLGHQL